MVQIQRKVKCVTIIDGIKFLPGVNLLSDPEVEKLQDNKTFKEECDCGNMTIIKKIESEASEAVDTDDTKIRAQELVKEIKSVSVKIAEHTINEITDPAILKAVLESDGRVGIAKAANKRLEEIKSQVDDDLVPDSKDAPDGSGDDFQDKIGDSKTAREGTDGHSSVPALNE